MNLIGFWIAVAGIVVAFGALIYWCWDKPITEKQEDVVAILIKFGCILILAGGCTELYFVCGMHR